MDKQQNPQNTAKWACHPDMDPHSFVMEQFWDDYTDQQHELFNRLCARQMEILPGRAHDDYLSYIKQMGLGQHGIPRFEDINIMLRAATGWQIVPVPGLIPGDVFFEHLAQRRFPVTYWLRKPDVADYLPEPDLFHDLFGHVPMLLNPYVADYIQAYGRGGLKAMSHPGGLIRITRLYWYSIEFGLIDTPDGLRIYGAGILSSEKESIYAVESNRPHRLKFDVKRMMQTDYRYYDLQETYFVIDDFSSLVEATKPNFIPYYEELYRQPVIDPTRLLSGDVIITRGTVTDQ